MNLFYQFVKRLKMIFGLSVPVGSKATVWGVSLHRLLSRFTEAVKTELLSDVCEIAVSLSPTPLLSPTKFVVGFACKVNYSITFTRNLSIAERASLEAYFIKHLPSVLQASNPRNTTPTIHASDEVLPPSSELN